MRLCEVIGCRRVLWKGKNNTKCHWHRYVAKRKPKKIVQEETGRIFYNGRACKYCNRPAKVKFLCQMHYVRWKQGRPLNAPYGETVYYREKVTDFQDLESIYGYVSRKVWKRHNNLERSWDRLIRRLKEKDSITKEKQTNGEMYYRWKK